MADDQIHESFPAPASGGTEDHTPPTAEEVAKAKAANPDYRDAIDKKASEVVK